MSVQPSSLIFLVIIGIWAAYFVQYWVRRREHLATIRSVDAFSETMRVLERRTPLPSVDAGSQAPRTYAVSPARAMRPQVTVKRAEAHTMSRVETPTGRSSAPAASSAAARSSRSFASARVETTPAVMHPSRATRGAVLLAGLVGTLVFGVLSVMGMLLAWAPLVPFALAVGGFAWLRAGVQAEIRTRRALRREVRPQTRRDDRRRSPEAARDTAAVAVVTAQEPAPRRSAPAVEPGVVDESTPDGGRTETVVAADRTPEPAPFDISADAATEVATQPVAEPVVAEPVVAQPAAAVTPVLPEVDEDDIPLTWDPRPVPPPTYTMKARAPERPVATAEVQPQAEAEHPAYEELPERRISGL